MKHILVVSFLFLQSISNAQPQKSREEKYVLISSVKKNDREGPYEMAVANQKDIDKLSEPLRGLAAYYTCRIQCDCEFCDTAGHVICGLTSALGLGQQGSDKQLAMLKKWFPNDDNVRSAIKNNCSVGSPEGSDFLEYTFLSFNVRNDTVIVNAEYIHYSHGNTSMLYQKNIAVIKGNRIVFIKR